MHIEIKFDVNGEDVAIFGENGERIPLFPSLNLGVSGAADIPRKEMAQRLRSAIITVMSDEGYDRWELNDPPQNTQRTAQPNQFGEYSSPYDIQGNFRRVRELIRKRGRRG